MLRNQRLGCYTRVPLGGSDDVVPFYLFYLKMGEIPRGVVQEVRPVDHAVREKGKKGQSAGAALCSGRN